MGMDEILYHSWMERFALKDVGQTRSKQYHKADML